MGLFKNIFSKESATSDNELEVVASKETGYAGKAETLANIVATGLEKENYSGMNKQLSTIVQSNEEKETYVFEHPGVSSRYFATVLVLALTISFVYYLFIGAGTTYFSSNSELYSVGIFFIGVSLVVLVINIILIAKLLSAIRFKLRFDIYEELIGYKSLEFVEDISICSKQKEMVVIKDLQRAIKYKLIPQGHFSSENRVFMVSDKVHERYMEKPAVYDRYFQQMIEERHRIKSRTKRISQIMETGEQYIAKIHGYGTLVKDKNISRKIGRMENVVSMIFHEIDANPNQAQSLGVFLNYYLPTTEKLLDAYVTIDEKKASGTAVTQTRKEIEETINTIVIAFEGILEKLYEEYEMDISSDIAAIELSMKQEGLPI